MLVELYEKIKTSPQYRIDARIQGEIERERENNVRDNNEYGTVRARCRRTAWELICRWVERESIERSGKQKKVMLVFKKKQWQTRKIKA